MANIKTKTTYKAEDGREFDTQEEAERHETIRAATEAFEEAARQYNNALAGLAQTADGYPFKHGGYYIVYEHCYSEGIRHEYLWPRDSKMRLDNDRPFVSHVESTKDGPRIVEYALADVYAKERNAKLRLLEIRKRRLGWMMDDIATLEKELGIETEKGAGNQ